MRKRQAIPARVATVIVIAATLLALAPAGPAGAAIAAPVYRTDGVEGQEPSQTNPILGEVWDMETIGNTVFVAGRFSDVVDSSGSWPRHHQPFIAAFDGTTGDWIDWWAPAFNGPIWALDTLPNGNLLAGGEFTTVDGEPHRNLVALETTTGEIDPSFRAVVERPATEQPSVVRDVYVAGPDVWVIGNFSHVVGGPSDRRERVFKAARLSSADGTPDAQWKPEISGRSGWGIVPSADGQRVHLGGEFSYVNGDPETALLATVDSTTGALVPGWDHGSNREPSPLWYWPVGGIVYDLDVHGNNLYVSGAEHFWEQRDSTNGDSIAYHDTDADTQKVETIGDNVYIGCHCWESGRWMIEVDGATGVEQPTFTAGLDAGDGGWAATRTPDGCLWIGGDFKGTDQLVGRPVGSYWVGRFAKQCPPGGPVPHDVPSLTEPAPAGLLIPSGATWRYVEGAHPAGWTEPGFDDSGWASGPAELGFGDGDEATVIADTVGGQRITSAVFRHTFTVDNPATVPYLDLRLNADDGATVWLNGTPVAAENIAPGTITATTTATNAVWGPEESDFSAYRLDNTALTAGTNTLAVSIHQQWPTSADLTFDLSLAAAPDAPDGTHPPPPLTPPPPPPPPPPHPHHPTPPRPSSPAAPPGGTSTAAPTRAWAGTSPASTTAAGEPGRPNWATARAG